MKTKIISFGTFLLIFCLSIRIVISQDVIIKKNGDEIKAKVTEVGTTEIKYKKFENLETSPVYSILKSDVFMIKYADGTKDVFNTDSQSQPQQQNQPSTEPQTTIGKISKKQSSQSQGTKLGQKKIIVGTGFSLMNKYKVGNVNEFLQYVEDYNGYESRPADDGAPGIMTFDIGFRTAMDTAGKNWLGAGMQFVKTAQHAIWGSMVAYGGGFDVHWDGFFMNVPISFFHAVDSKNHFFVAVEPALDMGLISGNICIPSFYNGVDTNYTEPMSFGAGFHIAGGVDYVGKFFGVNTRLGYRYLKTPEVHYNDKSDTGYSAFYANGKNGETVKVDWSGLFFDIGIYLALDRKNQKK